MKKRLNDLKLHNSMLFACAIVWCVLFIIEVSFVFAHGFDGDDCFSAFEKTGYFIWAFTPLMLIAFILVATHSNTFNILDLLSTLVSMAMFGVGSFLQVPWGVHSMTIDKYNVFVVKGMNSVQPSVPYEEMNPYMMIRFVPIMFVVFAGAVLVWIAIRMAKKCIAKQRGIEFKSNDCLETKNS